MKRAHLGFAVFLGSVGCAASPPDSNGVGGMSQTAGHAGTGGKGASNEGGQNAASGGTTTQGGGGATGSTTGGTFSTPQPCVGAYRNLFKELGQSQAAIDAKLTDAWKSLFEGSDSEKVYYTTGSDEGYILDVNNNDVRSEGMSYGMMIAVQMNKREVFDRLWRWTTRYMRHSTGARKGYFAWQCGRDGSIRDANPASDGEAYFATGLLFAAGRWGNGGAFDYLKEAREILTTMLHKEDGGVVDSVTNMFNKQQKMVVFTPYASAATFTDPSYHLPAFYELWAAASAPVDQKFWSEAATVSRSFFGKTMHPVTGLAPDYANFDGSPTGNGHSEFRFDAWRVISNLAVDAAWWSRNPAAATLTERLLGFFRSVGIDKYVNQYDLSGNPLPPYERSPGLIAMNAVGALALPPGKANDFVSALWDLDVPTGKYRYYDGMLYFLGLLHASGNFRVYGGAAMPAVACP